MATKNIVQRTLAPKSTARDNTEAVLSNQLRYLNILTSDLQYIRNNLKDDPNGDDARAKVAAIEQSLGKVVPEWDPDSTIQALVKDTINKEVKDRINRNEIFRLLETAAKNRNLEAVLRAYDMIMSDTKKSGHVLKGLGKELSEIVEEQKGIAVETHRRLGAATKVKPPKLFGMKVGDRYLRMYSEIRKFDSKETARAYVDMAETYALAKLCLDISMEIKAEHPLGETWKNINGLIADLRGKAESILITDFVALAQIPAKTPIDEHALQVKMLVWGKHLPRNLPGDIEKEKDALNEALSDPEKDVVAKYKLANGFWLRHTRSIRNEEERRLLMDANKTLESLADIDGMSDLTNALYNARLKKPKFIGMGFSLSLKEGIKQAEDNFRSAGSNTAEYPLDEARLAYSDFLVDVDRRRWYGVFEAQSKRSKGKIKLPPVGS